MFDGYCSGLWQGRLKAVFSTPATQHTDLLPVIRTGQALLHRAHCGPAPRTLRLSPEIPWRAPSGRRGKRALLLGDDPDLDRFDNLAVQLDVRLVFPELAQDAAVDLDFALFHVHTGLAKRLGHVAIVH